MLYCFWWPMLRQRGFYKALLDNLMVDWLISLRNIKNSEWSRKAFLNDAKCKNGRQQSYQFNYPWKAISSLHATLNAANIYLFKVNNRNTRKRCEIYSKFTIKTPERHRWRHSGVFINNFEHILHLFLVFLWLTLNK